MNLNPLKLESRLTDWVFGDGHIVFKAVNPAANWLSHLFFQESQLLLDGEDSDDCVTFAAQKSLDAQMDLLLATAPASVISQITALGFMDTGIDGNKHFHSSPRFIGVMTGNKQAGNSTQEAFDVLRKYGTLPYTDLPPNVLTSAEYYAPMTPAQLAKAAQFLGIVGGSNAIQYHSLSQGSPKNLIQMAQVLQQAPLEIGVAVAANWNLMYPSPDPAENAAPQHCLMVYSLTGESVMVDDNYVPDFKILDAGYPINFVSQLVVSLLIVPEQQIVSDVATIIPQIASQPPAQQETLLQEVEEIVEDVAKII